MAPLSTLLLHACCCIIIKRSHLKNSPPPSNPTADDHHRQFPSTWIPLYLRKYTSFPFSNLPTSPASTATASASNSDYDADIELEIDDSTPDFSSVYASPRFFFSSPGLSNSILDSASTSVTSEEDMAVHTESPDPYSDFRKSMEEMVEARELHDVLANWESLQQLLLRYLSINPEPNHKFIAGAFADLLVSLMSPASS